MFDERVLDNGLTLIGERLPHFRSVTAGLWLGSGSQYEPRELNGVSHFLEHMLFKGTAKRSARQIAEVMDAVGGQLNAFTAKELTCVYAKVIDEHTELALDVIADLATGALFDPAELEKEKGVVLEEIAMVEDEPEDLAGELIMRARFGDQPLAWPILGTQESVTALTREQLIEYRRKMYRPECSVLAITGNYDWQKFVALCEKYLGSWARGDGACPSCVTKEIEPTCVRREKDIEQIHICLAYPGCEQGSARIYPTSIFNSVYGGAMSSRLFQEIREERGMAYSVYSYPAYYSGSGMLGVYAGASIQNAPEVLKLIREVNEELIRKGITKEEFENTREQLKGNYVLGQESASARMHALGRRKLLMGDTQTEDDVIRKLNAIDLDEVNSLIADTLTARCAVALVGKGADSLDVGSVY